MEEDRLKDVADVDAWVRQHGYRRLNQALLAGQFKGVALRAVRAWLLFRHDRQRRTAVFAVLALATALGGAFAFYWLPK